MSAPYVKGELETMFYEDHSEHGFDHIIPEHALEGNCQYCAKAEAQQDLDVDGAVEDYQLEN